MKKTLQVAATTYVSIVKMPLFYIFVLGFSVLIFFSQYFTMFGFGAEGAMLREVCSSSIMLAGIMMAVILSALTITEEIQQKTLYTILSKPVKRSQYYLGKYYGIFFAVASGMLFMFLVFVATLWSSEGSRYLEEGMTTDALLKNKNYVADFTAAYFRNELPKCLFVFAGGVFHTAIMLSFSLMFASHFSLVVNVGLSGFIFIAGHITNYLYIVAKVTGSAVFKGISALLYYILPNFENFNLALFFMIKKNISISYLMLAFGYTVIYCFAILFIGTMLYNKKEI